MDIRLGIGMWMGLDDVELYGIIWGDGYRNEDGMMWIWYSVEYDSEIEESVLKNSDVEDSILFYTIRGSLRFIQNYPRGRKEYAVIFIQTLIDTDIPADKTLNGIEIFTTSFIHSFIINCIIYFFFFFFFL